MTETASPRRRPRPQQDRSRATFEKLLTAADREFAERGSAAVTTTQIARRAGVSVGALYRFFPDKAAIANALGERYLHDAAERFAPLLGAIERLEDVADGLRPVVAAAAELALAHPGYYRLTCEISPDDTASAGSVVRVAMVTEFEALLVRLGAAADGPRLRPAITLVIETVRHTLATCPTTEPERSVVVGELTEMVVTYAAHRIPFS